MRSSSAERGVGRLAALLVAAALGSCARTRLPKYEASDWARASVAEGRRLFRAVCIGCHGVDGRANVPAARIYFPRPRNLTRGEYRFRTTASGVIPQRDDLVRTIAMGLPGTAMPAWGPQLDAQQLMSLVLYIETLSPRFQDEDEAIEDDDILVHPGQLHPPPMSSALVARGRGVYQRMKCADCHGEQGRGNGPSSKTTKNQDGTRSDVFDFTYGVFKGGNRAVDIYRTFMTGLDGTPMPSYADSIPDKVDRWALVYYVMSLRRPRGVWFYLLQRPTWRDPADCD